MQIQAEPGRPPGDLVPPPQDVEPVLHELLSPLWINFEKSCKKEKSFLFGHWLGELIMPDLEIHSKGDFQQDLTPKCAWLLLYMLMCTPLDSWPPLRGLATSSLALLWPIMPTNQITGL